MRVVFWGSPDFAGTILDAVLASAHTVVGAVTQPARPVGRGRRKDPRRVAPAAVGRAAEAAGLPVLAPGKPRGEEFLTALRALGGEVFLVAAYGEILPAAVLEMPPHGALNVHASLLPAYRGAAPVTRAILDGRRTTGITIMRMDAGLDTGPICIQAETTIEPEDSAGEVTRRLAALGGRLAVEALDRLAAGTLPEVAQDGDEASYAPKVEPAEARLDWSRPAEALARAARAFDPWPGAWTTWRGERLKVFRIEPLPVGSAAAEESDRDHPPPGTIVAFDPHPHVRTGDGAVRLTSVQPAGGRRMTGADWVRGRGPVAGDRLGDA
ncbi:MAG TPA: methionyl-tRNA formyltransferase [Gemmatimonadota bacterium]|nr:methionyl-tRNA formyltransferase [Gemmatimonadota bacterium]